MKLKRKLATGLAITLLLGSLVGVQILMIQMHLKEKRLIAILQR